MVKICYVALVLTACLAAQVYGIGDLETEWEKFQANYPMASNDPEEIARRKSNFAETHAEIQEHNSNPNATFEMDFNKFSAMDEEEKKKFVSYSNFRPDANSRYINADDFATDRQLPTSIDLSSHNCIQPVKNQGNCGSCWAFSATTVVEFEKCIRTGIKVALSEQQLVDCSTQNGGCNGGNEGLAFKYLASAGGQATAASYPYRAVQGKCNFARAVRGAVLSTRQPAVYIRANDTLTMKTLLSRNRLFSIGIAVVNSFFSYKSGVYTDNSACDIKSNILGYHAMTVVGYSSLDDVDYWVIRNSWGSSWGTSGYVLFKRGTNQCEVEKWPVTTTVTA